MITPRDPPSPARETRESFREWLWRQAETAQKQADNTEASEHQREYSFGASLILFGVIQEYDRRHMDERHWLEDGFHEQEDYVDD